MKRVDSYQKRKKAEEREVFRRGQKVDGGGKGLSEGRRTALRSIRIVAEESFPQGYTLGSLSIGLALGDCLE
jgi:hypothetical protein